MNITLQHTNSIDSMDPTKYKFYRLYGPNKAVSINGAYSLLGTSYYISIVFTK